MFFSKLYGKIVALLRFTERYTKTDMVYLAKGGFWLTVGQVVSSITAFGTAIALANLLPKETYGTFKYIIALAGILSAFTLPGANAAVIRSVARGMEKTVSRALRARMGWGAFGALLAAGIAGYYALHGNMELAFGSLIVGAFLPFFDPFTVSSSYLQAKRDFARDAYFGIPITVLSALALIVAVLFSQNLLVILFAYFASYMLLRAGAYALTIRAVPPEGGEDPEMVPHARHLSVINFFVLVATQIDKVLVFQLLGSVEVAVYSVATAIPDNIRSLVRNVAVVAAPKLAEAAPDEHPKLARAIFSRAWFVAAPLIAFGIAAYMIIAPFFYGLFFPAYAEAIPFSQLFALSVFAGLSALPMSLFQYQKQTKTLYALTISQSIVQVVLLLALIPLFGLWGAIIARLLGHTFTTLSSFAAMRFRPAS